MAVLGSVLVALMLSLVSAEMRSGSGLLFGERGNWRRLRGLDVYATYWRNLCCLGVRARRAVPLLEKQRKIRGSGIDKPMEDQHGNLYTP
jgi:hypothetical protein